MEGGEGGGGGGGEGESGSMQSTSTVEDKNAEADDILDDADLQEYLVSCVLYVLVCYLCYLSVTLYSSSMYVHTYVHTCIIIINTHKLDKYT